MNNPTPPAPAPKRPAAEWPPKKETPPAKPSNGVVFGSTERIVVGVCLLFVAGIVYALTIAGAEPTVVEGSGFYGRDRVEPGNDPSFGLFVGSMLSMVGGVLLFIGIVAKGVALGNRESVR